MHIKRFAGLILFLVFGLLVLTACGGTADAPAAAATAVSSATGAETRVKVHPELGVAPPVVVPSSDGPAARGQTGPTSDVAGVCLSADEAELARMINEYRAEKGLAPYQISKSLTLVAQQHVWDTTNNFNNWPAPPAGKTCNLHSWSGVVNPALKEGTWTPLCYTNQHDNAPIQWIKPSEIAGYPGEANEISFGASAGATPLGAMTAWKNSPGHHGALIDQGVVAIGVGLGGNWAHVWLSHTADPIGVAPLCAGAVVIPPTVAAPTAVPPTAVPPTEVPPTAVPPTAVPPTTDAPTTEAPTAVPPTDVPPTAVPPTDVPPTAVPPTDVPPTAVPPTDVPPTAVPPTAVPPTAAAPTGTILNASGTITAGSTGTHAIDVFPGRSYTVVVSPSAELDAEPLYQCGTGSARQEGSFDWGWEGEVETLQFTVTSPTNCTFIVGGYSGSTGTYTITATAQ